MRIRNMKKCDFCTQSSPSGKCYWESQRVREEYCEKAIEKMVKFLKGNEKQ